MTSEAFGTRAEACLARDLLDTETTFLPVPPSIDVVMGPDVDGCKCSPIVLAQDDAIAALGVDDEIAIRAFQRPETETRQCRLYHEKH